ncbi:putative mixed-lineage leukemia protein, mll [Corchorus olitorius]|uniref:Mixed-lineage leukemia protein, mll n=1 Tax=Corchorus olitorius TaxID=93759 RepID=A0A1R3J7H3_9ROSI|nr:putative mixed-lineage leukemia protein, mll [Corchorus olitorius]
MPLDQGGKVNGQLPRRIACHASQWRDVPCKQKEACKLKHMNPSAEVLDASGCAEGQHGDAGMHFIGSAANRDDSFKGQDMSNISSGCSAPVVTQASIEVNNMDSSTIDAGDNGYINGLIVDEGSGIDKCSSNDARESERSAEFPGVSCRSKIRNKGFSKTMNGQSSFSLLDELKLIDSLTWKKGKNQIYTSFTGSGRTNHLKRIRRGAKSGKRKRAVKFRMLDAASCPKVSFGHCPKDKGSPQVTSGLSKDRRTLIPPGLEPDEATHLIKPGDAASAKIVSQKRDLHGLYNDQDGEENYQPELEGEARFGNILEVSARKRLKRAWDSFENLEAPKPILKSFERTSKSNSLHSIKAFSSLEASVCDKKARPIVCGDYGEICSGNDTDNLRPAKIVPLSRILKNTEQCSLRKSYKPKSTLRKFKKKRPARRAPYFGSSLHLKKEEVNGFNEVSGCHVEDCEKTCVGGIKQFDNKSFILEKGKDDKSEINCSVRGDITYNWSKTRCKEIRKRSLYELTGKGLESASDNYPLMKISKCKQKMKVRKGLKKAGDVDLDGHRSCDINAEK